MKRLIAIIVLFSALEAFANPIFCTTMSRFEFKEYKFEEKTSSAVIHNEKGMELFVGSTEEAEEYLMQNSVNGFALVFNLRNWDAEIYEIGFLKIQGSLVEESGMASAMSTQLPIQLAYRLNSKETVQAACF